MYLLKYILKRVGLMLMTFFIIASMCFYFIKLLDDDPLPAFGKDYELLQLRRDMLGYDKPIPEQYIYYLFGRTEYSYIECEKVYEYDETGTPINSYWKQKVKTVKRLDSSGKPLLDSNGKEIYDIVYQTKQVFDEEGNPVYLKNEFGEYLDSLGRPTKDPNNYVIKTENVLDANGDPIPEWSWKYVYEKSKLPSYITDGTFSYNKKATGGVIRGYFGTSEVLFSGRDVWQVFADKVPYTVSLNIWSIIVSIPIGLALGIYAALRKNKWQDHVISTGVMVFVSVPSFIYAFLVKYLLYFKWGWFPATANTSSGPWSWTFISSIIPAILSMCFGTIAGFARYTRAELTEVLTSEFMLLARTKGLTRAQAVAKHALKNAMVVIFPMILGEFISIMSGSLIIEQLFSIPGVGELYINSISGSKPDYNIFMLLTCFYTFIGLAAGIVIDISYGIIDPRIRMGAK